MKAQAFDELLSSVREAGRIHRGKARPSRRTSFRVADVKAIRAGLGQTQEAFATMIGVSVATLRNWEQGRRTPEGPALALLRVAEAEPIAVARALIGEHEGGVKVPAGGRAGRRGVMTRLTRR
ncbi:MAG: NadS family protein [Gemmatimonadaceae bacterium]